MTQPTTPDGALTRAVARLAKTRETTRALSEEIRERRQRDQADVTPPVEDGQP